ncbi:MAG: adenylate cyclase [Gammaproteobacteria bacterium]|jgi:adenylate cyclase
MTDTLRTIKQTGYIYAVNNNILQNKYRIGILLTIFVLYLFNGIGAFDISFRSEIDINFNSRVLVSTLSTVINHPFSIQSINLLLMLVSGIFLSICLPLATPINAAILSLITYIPHFYIYLISSGAQLILPMEYNLLIIFILFSLHALISYFIETHSKQKILHVFGQFVPPEIISEISKNPDSINLQGESRHMTVFFCDLQDFTTVSEQLNPKQLTMLLNEYFNAMTEILYNYGGTIDKYIGDSIMAFWNAPVLQINHAERAVLAAFDMQAKINLLSENFRQRGWPGPTMGIGINTGAMNVGNMGSRYRIAYTVIGDAVNLASRVESLTRTYRVPILVSHSTKNECKNIVFREIDTVQVKGKHNVTRIYQPICKRTELTNKTESQLERHHQGIEAYTNQNLELAKKIFLTLNEESKDDEYYPTILKKIALQEPFLK